MTIRLYLSGLLKFCFVLVVVPEGDVDANDERKLPCEHVVCCSVC